MTCRFPRRASTRSRVATAVATVGLALALGTDVTFAASYGLEWPGDGAVRRMLYWHNPFPIYDATYVFKVYPRKKTDPYDFFLGQ